MRLQHTIKAVVREGDEPGYPAEWLGVPVVTQGETLDELVNNLREAIGLALENEDLESVARQWAGSTVRNALNRVDTASE